MIEIDISVILRSRLQVPRVCPLGSGQDRVCRSGYYICSYLASRDWNSSKCTCSADDARQELGGIMLTWDNSNDPPN